MSKTEWIRCEDRLPEDEERILFTTDYFVAGHKITVAGRFDSEGNRFIPIEEAPQDEYFTCEIECWTPYPDSKCKSGWIKCSERLPEPGLRVFATDGRFVGESYISAAGNWYRYGTPWTVAWKDWSKDNTTVTHWMYLPTAPEVDA